MLCSTPAKIAPPNGGCVDETLYGIPFHFASVHSNSLASKLPKHFQATPEPFEAHQKRMPLRVQIGPGLRVQPLSSMLHRSWATKCKLVINVQMREADPAGLTSIITGCPSLPPSANPTRQAGSVCSCKLQRDVASPRSSVELHPQGKCATVEVAQ